MVPSPGELDEQGAGPQRQQVLVTFLDGQELQGTVNTLNPQLPNFFLHLGAGEGASARRVAFTEIKSVAFLKPPQQRASPAFPASARLVTVRYMDNSVVQGITQVYSGQRQGIFLAPTGRDEVDRLYVPLSAIREVVSVQRLGEILAEQRMATREMVEDALLRQRQLREEPLGQILLQEKLIADHQLAAGLSLQRERHGARIGEILLEQGFVSSAELAQALEVQKHQRSKKLGEVMIEMGYASPKMVGIALSIQYNVPFVSLATHVLDPALRDLVPAEFARRWTIAPFSLQDGVLAVALVDPADLAFKGDLRTLTGLVTTEVVATPQDLARAIAGYYGD